MRYHLLAPPTPSEMLFLAPPAPSGGAWGDASPQTPAKQTVWPIVKRVLVSAVAVADAGLAVRRGAWRSRRGREDHGPFPISKRHDTHDECLAGVWGEASPQAPPEGAGGARKGAQAPPEGARGARNEILVGVGGTRAPVPGEALWDISRWS